MTKKDIKIIIENCPRSYNQNVKKLKNLELIILNDYCFNIGNIRPTKPFRKCRLWKNRIKCWEKLFE